MRHKRSSLGIVILAAGLGKRMHSQLPKVLHRLGGRPLLRHVLDAAKQLRPKKIAVVVGHGGDAVRNEVVDASVKWVKQEPQLGTGHAVMKALPHVRGVDHVLVLYGDVPLVQPETLAHLVAAGRKGRLALLAVELENPFGYGRVVQDAKNRVCAIVEEKDATPRERKIRKVNTGTLVAPRKKLDAWVSKLKNDNAQKEYYLTDIVGLAVKGRYPVEAVAPGHAQEALGVNSKAELARLERAYQWRQAKRLMDAGVTLLDPSRFDMRGELHCGRDVEIDVNCVFEGKVVLGPEVRVGAHCILKNVRAGKGTMIAPHSVVEDANIGKNCRIGPFARVRPGTRLGEDVHIGNFVEVKNSDIGPGSKANHLSYVGDASVGRDVNVGAGTITCNYDGASKHRTVIEDDVFIGSDTQLVAPVTVRRGATIGAGSTITRQVPPGALTLSRSKQVTVPGWRRPKKTAKKRKNDE